MGSSSKSNAGGWADYQMGVNQTGNAMADTAAKWPMSVPWTDMNYLTDLMTARAIAAERASKEALTTISPYANQARTAINDATLREGSEAAAGKLPTGLSNYLLTHVLSTNKNAPTGRVGFGGLSLNGLQDALFQAYLPYRNAIMDRASGKVAELMPAAAPSSQSAGQMAVARDTGLSNIINQQRAGVLGANANILANQASLGANAMNAAMGAQGANASSEAQGLGGMLGLGGSALAAGGAIAAAAL